MIFFTSLSKDGINILIKPLTSTSHANMVIIMVQLAIQTLCNSTSTIPKININKPRTKKAGLSSITALYSLMNRVRPINIASPITTKNMAKAFAKNSVISIAIPSYYSLTGSIDQAMKV